MAAWSLARRLTALLGAGLVLLWFLAVAAALAIVDHEIGEVFDGALQQMARRMLPLAELSLALNAVDSEGERTVGNALASESQDAQLVYQLRGADGAVLLRSHDAPREAFEVPLRPGFVDAAGWRYYTEAAGAEGPYLQVGELLEHRTEAVFETIVWLAAPLLILLPLVGVAIWWSGRAAVKPIAALGQAIAGRGGANLAPLAEANLPSELAPIVQDVNRLLERLDRALQAERAFAANSAHELRTPVAAALGQAQRLARELAGLPERERAEHIATVLRRLAALVDKLLQLSRADAGIALTREPIDVLPALRAVLDEFARREIAPVAIRFDDGGRTELLAHTDPDAFGIVVRNLIENAVTHGDKERWVDVWLAKDGTLHVVNDCPPVPPELLHRLTGRFERGTASVSGSGLGLAIAATIMRQAGGTLDLRSPATSRARGFEAIVRLA